MNLCSVFLLPVEPIYDTQLRLPPSLTTLLSDMSMCPPFTPLWITPQLWRYFRALSTLLRMKAVGRSGMPDKKWQFMMSVQDPNLIRSPMTSNFEPMVKQSLWVKMLLWHRLRFIFNSLVIISSFSEEVPSRSVSLSTHKASVLEFFDRKMSVGLKDDLPMRCCKLNEPSCSIFLNKVNLIKS